MKRSFLLDESFIGAFTAGNEGAVRLLSTIARKCHRLILSSELLKKYWRLRKYLDEKGRMSKDPASYIGYFAYSSEKSDFRDNAPQVSEEKRIHHQKDAFLIRFAAAGGAVVVLQDDQTKTNINDAILGTSYDIVAVTIPEALPLAEEN